jgi:hypothetical protein
MKKCLFFAMVAFAFITQSCGDDTKESQLMNRGPLANNPANTEVSNEKGKYFCDFQWTQGDKNWEYGPSGDKPVGTDKAKAPWCLIPYGYTTYYTFSFKASAGETRYACRDKKEEYFFQMLNDTAEISIEYGYDDRIVERTMKCVELKPNERITVTGGGATLEYPNGIPDLPNSRDDRLYYVVKIGDRYIIEGHLNLRFVKLVELKVAIGFVDAGGFKNNLDNGKNRMVNSLKSYLEKAGYILKTIDVIYKEGGLGLIDVNGLYNQYDYVIGVVYDTKNRKMMSNDRNISVISDDENFFNTEPEEKARMLAALLYSKILQKKDPTKDQDDRWLSYYTKRLDFSQPSEDWREGRYIRSSQQLLEFAMQYFKGE